MEVFCLLGLVACAVVIIGCTANLETRLNALDKRERVDFEIHLNNSRDLYNNQKNLEYRIQCLETAINKQKSEKEITNEQR